MSQGSRMKNPLLKSCSLEAVKAFFEGVGKFEVTALPQRTARYLTVQVRVKFTSPNGEDCCRYPAEIKIGDDKVIFRWYGIAPKQYYHLDTAHRDHVAAQQVRATATWGKFEKLHAKEQ